MIALDQILQLLMNGGWHELKEITDKTGLPEVRVELITSFLSEYNFLQFNKKQKRIRLSSALSFFLKRIEKIERESISGKRQFH